MNDPRMLHTLSYLELDFRLLGLLIQQAPRSSRHFLSAKIRKNGPQIRYLSCLKSAISDKGLHVMPQKGNLL